MTRPAQRRNEIQWLRALAATEVMVVHSDLIVKYFSATRIAEGGWYDAVDSIGVELFFIVSGYIMCMRAPASGGWWRFIVSRVVRIYPMYWLFTSIVVLVGVTNPAWRLGGFDLDFPSLARAYLVLPGWHDPILAVGWTLEYEMVFYCIVMAAMALGLTQARRSVAFAWIIAGLGLVGCLVGKRTEGSALLYHLFSPYMFAFGIGWLFRAVEEQGWQAQMRSILPFVLVAALAVSVGTNWSDWLIFRIALVAVLFRAVLSARRVFQADNSVNRLFWLIGDASYSIYLSHWFVLSASGKMLGKLGLPAGLDPPLRILGIVASTAIGILIFRHIEQPIGRWLHGTQARKPTTRIEPAATASTAEGASLRPLPEASKT